MRVGDVCGLLGRGEVRVVVRGVENLAEEALWRRSISVVALRGGKGDVLCSGCCG